MASFDPIIRRNENVFRVPEKMRSKIVRKPLGDLTNSSKPVDNKSSAKTFNGLKGPEKAQIKVARIPLGDLTNSRRPPTQEKSSKKDRVETVSAVVGVQKANSWIKEEGFLHNHDECVKAQTLGTTMSLDYFLETVGLKKDPFVSSLHTTEVSKVSVTSNHELETPLELAEFEIDMSDVCAPPSPPSPKAPGSPCWNIDWNNLNFSPVKLKESPVRN